MDWQKVGVTEVSGKEVTLHMTGQFKNGTTMPHSGDIYTCDVETGATNYTHSVLGFVIAADLEEGEVVSSGSNTFVINKTEIKTYMGVSRVVNVFAVVLSDIDQRGPYTVSLTWTYDKASGMLLEMESWTKWSSTTNDRVIYSSVTDTNIFLIQTASVGLPTEYFYPLIAGVAGVAVAMSASAVIVFRRRIRPEAKTMMLEEKVKDLTFNLSGVNRGECYLTESLEHCAKVVCDLHLHGVKALVIAREDPEFLSQTCKIQPDDVVLISAQPIKGFKAINSLQEISVTIMKFVKADGGIVLLDGLEYLISRFGFNAVLMMLQEKKIEFLEAGAVLLVPVIMETLNTQEKGQLISELKIL
jgi:hypothetical protein